MEVIMKTLKIAYLGAGEISDRFIVMASKLKGVENAAIFSRKIKNEIGRAHV